MLSLPPSVRILLCSQPTDMRKSFDTLAALVRDGLKGDPLSGHLFVFRNRAGDRLKLLFWDTDGYVIYYKRRRKAAFSSPRPRATAASRSARRLRPDPRRHRPGERQAAKTLSQAGIAGRVVTVACHCEQSSRFSNKSECRASNRA